MNGTVLPRRKSAGARHLGAAVFALLALGIPTGGAAQARLTGADLEGVVKDESGDVLSDAAVTIVNRDTAVARTIATDTHGRFRLPALPLGRYSITIDRAGFARLRREGLVLVLGESALLELTMKVAAVEEAVTVVAETRVVHAGHTAVSTVVSQEQVQHLPINGRNFLSFTVLTPGVTTDRTPQQGALATSGLSFTGQRGRSNNITVDGFDNNDPAVGAVRATFSQEAVREFQVLTNSYSAEFGKAAGGVVNIVTRSGTNDVRGTAFCYFRDEALNAKDHFERFDPFDNSLDREKRLTARSSGWGPRGAHSKGEDLLFRVLRATGRRGEQLRQHRPARGDLVGRERIPRRARPRAVRDPHNRCARQDRSSVLADQYAGRSRQRRHRPQREHRAVRRARGEKPRCRAASRRRLDRRVAHARVRAGGERGEDSVRTAGLQCPIPRSHVRRTLRDRRQRWTDARTAWCRQRRTPAVHTPVAEERPLPADGDGVVRRRSAFVQGRRGRKLSRQSRCGIAAALRRPFHLRGVARHPSMGLTQPLSAVQALERGLPAAYVQGYGEPRTRSARAISPSFCRTTGRSGRSS